MATAPILVLEERASYLSDDARASATQPYTQVRNELLDIAMPHLSSGAFCVVMRVERWTSGFHRDSAVIPISRLVRETGLSKPTVLRAVEELEQAHIIHVETVGAGRARESTFCILNREQWALALIGQNSLPIDVAENIGKEPIPIDDHIGQNSLPMSANIGQNSLPPIKKDKKEKREKEKSAVAERDTPTRKVAPTSPSTSSASPTYSHDSDAYLLAAHQRDAIASYKPDAHFLPTTEAKMQSWARVMDLLIRVDKRDVARAHEMIDWAANDEFWHTNILSPGKFRAQFDTLELRASSEKTQRRKTSPPARAAPPAPAPLPSYPQASSPWAD